MEGAEGAAGREGEAAPAPARAASSPGPGLQLDARPSQGWAGSKPLMWLSSRAPTALLTTAALALFNLAYINMSAFRRVRPALHSSPFGTARASASILALHIYPVLG